MRAIQRETERNSTIFQYISWRSVLLVEKTGVPAENHRLVKNRHFLLLIIDISKHGAKEMGYVKMAGPGFVNDVTA
jgi:hypothetical protein